MHTLKQLVLLPLQATPHALLLLTVPPCAQPPAPSAPATARRVSDFGLDLPGMDDDVAPVAAQSPARPAQPSQPAPANERTAAQTQPTTGRPAPARAPVAPAGTALDANTPQHCVQRGAASGLGTEASLVDEGGFYGSMVPAQSVQSSPSAASPPSAQASAAGVPAAAGAGEGGPVSNDDASSDYMRVAFSGRRGNGPIAGRRGAAGASISASGTPFKPGAQVCVYSNRWGCPAFVGLQVSSRLTCC